MAKIIVLFNLKPDASAEDYEAWARRTDMPTVRSLGSVAGFDVLKCLSVRGSDKAVPYQYVEMINVADMDGFGRDVSTEHVRAVAAEFRRFADNPVFINCEQLEP